MGKARSTGRSEAALLLSVAPSSCIAWGYATYPRSLRPEFVSDTSVHNLKLGILNMLYCAKKTFITVDTFR